MTLSDSYSPFVLGPHGPEGPREGRDQRRDVNGVFVLGSDEDVCRVGSEFHDQTGDWGDGTVEEDEVSGDKDSGPSNSFGSRRSRVRVPRSLVPYLRTSDTIVVVFVLTNASGRDVTGVRGWR